MFRLFPYEAQESILQNNTFILRKIAEDIYDMAYQIYRKIVISKEECLHYVIQPLELRSQPVDLKIKENDKRMK